MAGCDTKFERLELKYLIDESKAAQVRADIQLYCSPDPYNRPASGSAAGLGSRGYWVYSLYLDTLSLAFHRAKERGDPERFKLRLRSYSPKSAAFFELKRKYSDVIDKTRTRVDRAGIERAALGFGVGPHETPEAAQFLNRFSQLVLTTGAQPTLLVRYQREGYVSSVDDYARVTFDRCIEAQRVTGWDLAGDPEHWCALEQHLTDPSLFFPVVLELKCRSTVPYWLTDLVQRHDLRRQSFSKYSIGIYMTGREEGSYDLARRCDRILN